jgi:hypothetical protein
MEWYNQLSETCTNIWRAVAGKVYVVGGYGPGWCHHKSAEMYDPESNTWQLISDMGTERSELSCVALRGCVYAIGKNCRYCNIPLPPSQNLWYCE